MVWNLQHINTQLNNHVTRMTLGVTQNETHAELHQSLAFRNDLTMYGATLWS